jgi:hypothetical protein
MRYALILALIGTAHAQTVVVAEGGRATLAAPALVEYGARDRWAYRYAPAGSLMCNNAAAGGDPIVNVRKECRAYLINTASCSPRLMGGTGQGGAFGFGTSGVWHSFWCPSVTGPRLRIMAGSWAATAEAATCINSSTETVANAIRSCAQAEVTAEPLRSIWSSDLRQIVSSKPQ